MPVTAVIETPPDEQTAETFRIAEEHFGHVPNLVKVLATNPALCSSITKFIVQALQEGRVSWAFKQLVILKTMRAVGSHYAYGAHEELARQLGNSSDRIGDLNNSLWRSSPHFTVGERAVFELIEQIGVDANAVGDDIWTPLKAEWDNGQLLELTSLITTFINIGRIGDTLGVSEEHWFSRPVA